jgi:hypothetical protein
MLVYNPVIECFMNKVVVKTGRFLFLINSGGMMTTDLLFSILPREGKVPIAHDSQKVAKIDRQEALRPLSDEEKELKGEERDARKKNQQHNKNAHSPEQESSSEQVEKEDSDTDQKKPKGPKHLDIYV